ncbi:MAG: LysR family transcriptional regulator [Acidobacteria bacterium]|nr:LysR family transcriptional regulator [Acidobacteriota bacterium]
MNDGSGSDCQNIRIGYNIIPRMELRQLRYFAALARELNFSRAARRLNISQPPLSRQIQQLESELGLRLFVRNKRSVHLTDAGRALLAEAESLIDHAARLKDMASLAAQGKAGVVRIGIGMGLGEHVNAAVTEHSKHFPSVEVELHDIFSTRQNHALRERMIDVGFMRPPVDTGLMSEPIVKEHFEVIICRKHPLALKKSLTLAELAFEPLLIHDRSFSTALYDKILDLYRRAGVSPKVTQSSSFPYEEAGAMLIASGKGIYLGVSSAPGTGTTVCHPLFVDQLSAVPLQEPGANLDVQVAWRARENSPAILSFLKTVRYVFRTERGGGRQDKTWVHPRAS